MTAPKHLHGKPPYHQALAAPSPAWVIAGRLLLCLAGILLVVMPFTEHLWAGDRFLRGGQDVELTLLAVLTFCCMVLVFAQACRHTLRSLLKLRFISWLLGPSRPRESSSGSLSESRGRTFARSLSLPVYSLPLQI